jgi:hypothetical protein
MRERIFEIILFVLDRYIERCCVPISFYSWQCWGTLVDLQYPVSCSLQASSGIFFKTYALASRQFRAIKDVTRPPTIHRERCDERWLCRRPKSSSELALSTSSLPGSSKNALDSVDSAGDPMAAYLGLDRQPVFANKLFMAGKVELESLQSVPDVKNQRNKKSLAHINSGLGPGQIYERCLEWLQHPEPPTTLNTICLLSVTTCSRGIFETETQAYVHGCTAGCLQLEAHSRSTLACGFYMINDLSPRMRQRCQLHEGKTARL